MGLFTFIGNFKENRRRYYRSERMKDDPVFAWKYLKEVALEIKLGVWGYGNDKAIRENFRGFNIIYDPYHGGRLAAWGMRERVGLHEISDSYREPSVTDEFKFSTGDAEFDAVFTKRFATPKIQLQINEADGLREQMVRFYRTWLGAMDPPHRVLYNFRLTEHKFDIVFNYSVPHRAYHVGEDRPLDDPEEFKAAVRDFFDDLEALLKEIEGTLGDAR